MPSQTWNEEKAKPRKSHGLNTDIFRDMIVGFADGLTVPFALTAGLSSLGSSKLVVIGGLAELFSGSISMGLGAYLAALTERDHYSHEESQARTQVLEHGATVKQDVFESLNSYGIDEDVSRKVITDLASDTDSWVRFVMDFEVRVEKPNMSRPWISAITMGLAYFIGGIIPMIPYFSMHNVTHALFTSIGITVFILIVFGFVKNWVIVRSTRSGIYGAVQTLCIGALAAGASYGIVRAIDSTSPGQTGAVARSLRL